MFIYLNLPFRRSTSDHQSSHMFSDEEQHKEQEFHKIGKTKGDIVKLID